MELRNLAWISVVSFVCWAFVGLDVIAGLTGAILLLVFSFVVGLVVESESAAMRMRADQALSQFSDQPAMWKERYRESKSLRADKRITGSSLIDDELQELLQYILRDYVEAWYTRVGGAGAPEFLFEIRQSLQKVATNLSTKCKEVDWLPFLTTRLSENAASHIRLYRQARTKWKDSHQGATEASQQALEQVFFDLEFAREKNKMCRRRICTDPDHEKECLKMISDLFLLLVGPAEDTNCRPVQLLSSEILHNVVILPLLQLLSDPDYINQMVVWMCKDFPVTSESFLTVLRYTESAGELEATKEMLNREIALLRSHDLGGDNDISIKQQLSSLLYVKKIVDHRLHKMLEGSDNDSLVSANGDWNKLLATHGNCLYQLPLDVILKNNVALSYLLDFMSMIGSQAYLFFLLNAEGWKIATEQQIASMELEGFHTATELKKNKRTNQNLEHGPYHQILSSMREASMSIYEQYLSEKAAPRLRIDEVVVRRLLYNIKNEPPVETWFDDVQAAVIEKLQKDERFMPAFRKSVGYVRMLAELDLLKDVSKSDDEDSRSLDDISVGESSSLYSYDIDDRNLTESPGSGEIPARNVDCIITASISQKGVVKEGLSSHAVYAVTVVKSLGAKEIENWIVYRRYSDFLDFHQRMESRFKGLSDVVFPGKRTFNNMDKLFLERRQFLLNEYLHKLLNPDFLSANPGLQAQLLQFFDRGAYEHSKGVISRKMDSLVNPFVSSVRTVTEAVKRVPSNLFKDSSRPNDKQDLNNLPDISASDFEGDDNVPLRILLILLDEVFDLRSRNQWLRKRIFYMLREILRAMYGDVFNKRIVDSIGALTSPEQVAESLRILKNSLWPSGVPAMIQPGRDQATKMRTRVAAKMALLACISDEMKHLIGNETTRQGVFRVFELFQQPVLNRRLVYVLLEDLVSTMFPQNNIKEFFKKLHSAAHR